MAKNSTLNLIVFVSTLLLTHACFANDQDTKQVLNKIHQAGFYGCDNALSGGFSGLSWRDVKRVEAKLVDEKLYQYDDSDRGRLAIKNMPDSKNANAIEFDVVVNTEDGFSAVNSYLVRKIQGKCFAWSRGSVSVPVIGCDQLLAQKGNTVVDNIGIYIFQRSIYSKEPSDISGRILINVGNNTCLSYSRGGILNYGGGVDMDSPK